MFVFCIIRSITIYMRCLTTVAILCRQTLVFTRYAARKSEIGIKVIQVLRDASYSVQNHRNLFSAALFCVSS
jgi:hypothetical protein